MNSKTFTMVIPLLLTASANPLANEPPMEEDDRSNPVLDLMLETIAPSTNRLWGIKNPTSAEEWLAYEEASTTVLNASEALRGAHPDPRWQIWLDQMSTAARKASAAAREKDVERFTQITREELYAACEACHAVFDELDVAGGSTSMEPQRNDEDPR